MTRKRTAMNVRQLRISRRSLTIVAALAGVVSLAIGAHAALNKRALDAAKAIATEQSDAANRRVSKVALVIGNGHYPDANAPLAQPINDARALTSALRGNGVQVGRESYMIPVDAAIWKESDVRRQGVSIEAVLEVMKAQGARAKLVVVDASRRNPYERRFRKFSHGLAPINAPENALILASATPGKVADDSAGPYSVLVTELLNNLNANLDTKTAAGVETVFNKTRVAISRASEGAQVPSVSSSLSEDVRLEAANANVGG